MTQVFHQAAEINQRVRFLSEKKIGFVPTMGALHRGHKKLLRRAKTENDVVVLSIFVNKTQFNESKDYDTYPQDWEADLLIAQECGVDYVFAPSYQDIYPDGYTYKVSEQVLSTTLCGQFRPGHFDGVLTVVLKLFQIIQPHRAYFGEKDYQQFLLIQGMVRAFFLPIQIIPVETEREDDGLALSSRNLRLTQENRAKAPQIFQILGESASAQAARDQLEKNGFEVEYVVDQNGRRFVAAHLGGVRLIDNIKI